MTTSNEPLDQLAAETKEAVQGPPTGVSPPRSATSNDQGTTPASVKGADIQEQEAVDIKLKLMDKQGLWTLRNIGFALVMACLIVNIVCLTTLAAIRPASPGVESLEKIAIALIPAAGVAFAFLFKDAA